MKILNEFIRLSKLTSGQLPFLGLLPVIGLWLLLSAPAKP